MSVVIVRSIVIVELCKRQDCQLEYRVRVRGYNRSEYLHVCGSLGQYAREMPNADSQHEKKEITMLTPPSTRRERDDNATLAQEERDY
jgi:hypothetical protein